MHERRKAMPKNDMHLIIYKLLRFLYDCNKQGKIPTFSDMFKVIELSTIPQSYLAQILMELIDNGYVSGCDVTATKDTILIDLSENAHITVKGLDYLTESSRMKKAQEVAGKAFEILLSSIIAYAMSK